MESQPSPSGGGRHTAQTRAAAFEDLAQSFADGGRGPEPRSAGAWRSWKRQRDGLSLEPPAPTPAGTQPCPHLYPSPVRSGLDFQPPHLQEKTCLSW